MNLRTSGAAPEVFCCCWRVEVVVNSEAGGAAPEVFFLRAEVLVVVVSSEVLR